MGALGTHEQTVEIDGKTITFEAGTLAQQAGGAVISDGALWVTNTGSDTVSQISLASQTVTRIIDQDKAFLRFVESHDLKPGQTICVEARDTASDSVRLRGKGEHPITIGARAASKLLVDIPR